MSADAVEWRVRGGQWRRLHPGVYQTVEHRPGAASRLRAAVYASGGIAHGISAAWWLGLVNAPPAQPHVTVPQRRRLEAPRGAVLRRSNIDPSDIAVVRGVGVTKVPLTVLEVGDSVLIDQALQTRVTLAMLNASLARNSGRAGMKRARTLLKVAESGGRSEAERLLHVIIRPIPGWLPQFPVGPHRLDAGFGAVRVGIEVDGWRWHKDSRRNSEDMRRQNFLVNHGWVILRYDWHRLTREPDAVHAEIAHALRSRRLTRAQPG